MYTLAACGREEIVDLGVEAVAVCLYAHSAQLCKQRPRIVPPTRADAAPISRICRGRTLLPRLEAVRDKVCAFCDLQYLLKHGYCGSVNFLNHLGQLPTTWQL